MRRLSVKRGLLERWSRPALRLGAIAVPALVLAGLGFWAARSPDRLLGATAAMGLAVADIQVEGRQMTSREALLQAIGAGRGTPILAVSPARARAELERIPWVRRASVERLLPDTLFVRIAEREPFALWQFKGKMALIDRDGTVITDERLERWPSLPLVVGEDARNHAAEIVEILATEPALQRRVYAAVRVGGRRWNLKLDNGIEVQLPERDPAAAWAQLARVERQTSVLAKNVEAVDLRLPDRLVVRTVPEPPKETPKKGKPKNT